MKEKEGMSKCIHLLASLRSMMRRALTLCPESRVYAKFKKDITITASEEQIGVHRKAALDYLMNEKEQKQ